MIPYQVKRPLLSPACIGDLQGLRFLCNLKKLLVKVLPALRFVCAAQPGRGGMMKKSIIRTLTWLLFFVGIAACGGCGETTPPPTGQLPAYEFLGGLNSYCLNVPFTINGIDYGIKVGVQLGTYQEGVTPEFGVDKEAEITVSGNEITVNFHPLTAYNVNDPARNGGYWLYVGLLEPHKMVNSDVTFEGCGYNGQIQMPSGTQQVYFKGDFMWMANESDPPPGSGFGNTLLGGRLAYDFPDGNREIVAIDDFGVPINTAYPPTLDQARFYCSDWWHDLQWADWYDETKVDQWQSFEINISAANRKAIQESINCFNINEGRRLDDARYIRLPALFVGPEYKVTDGNQSVFKLRNLRMETY